MSSKNLQGIGLFHLTYLPYNPKIKSPAKGKLLINYGFSNKGERSPAGQKSERKGATGRPDAV